MGDVTSSSTATNSYAVIPASCIEESAPYVRERAANVDAIIR
jgi:hypothetical protein